MGVVLLPAWAAAASPSAEQALKLEPVQPDVDFDRPTADEAAKCKILAKRFDGQVGWIVEGPTGVLLRKFVDTNNDNVVDLWCYYKDGLEVYRDIDSNFNGKADQHRWFHTGGSRWGMDSREDGVIDSWRAISAEEVSAEAVAAIATRDARRFTRLLLSPAELESLGLGKARSDAVAEKIQRAAADFASMAERQKTLAPKAAWLQFSANRPGVIPAGVDGSTKDLRVYENGVAFVESDGRHVQLEIGTLVQVGDAWRLIDLPRMPVEGKADAAPHGFFFQASMTSRTEAPTGAPSEAMQKLLADLEKLDRRAAEGGGGSHAQNIDERSRLLEQIAAAAKTSEERGMWLRQLADMISAAVQSGECPDGAERLATLYKKLDKNESDARLAAYVKFRQLMAGYVLAMQAPKADFAKIQSQWLKTLEGYIADYPTAPDAAEAMLQLAINQEFAGQEDDARKWYARTVSEFPDSPQAKKAAGAQTRLDSVGKTIALSGTSPAGRPVDLADYRGKAVLVHYWATWSRPAKSDLAALKELQNKYGGLFAIVGVSLDNDVKDLNAYLAENPLPWPQIFESGGLDSEPANALGILTVPTMILIDRDGRVVHRNIVAADLEAELKKLIR